MGISTNVTMKNDIDELFNQIVSARHCIALTGAGVSTLSGIRDFRGKNGLYKDMDAEKIFDIDYFDKDPTFYYQAARAFIYNIHEKAASVVHTVLGTLENKGFLKALITQNIDLLHQKGGSRRVIEIHGSPGIHYCRHCGDPSNSLMDFDRVAALVKAGDVPRCPQCSQVLKPGITFFGESLPVKALSDAESEARQADLMLVLGTSLTVYPAASIPHITLRAGGRIVIVNNMETPLDRHASLRFTDLGEVFEGLAALLT